MNGIKDIKKNGSEAAKIGKNLKFTTIFVALNDDDKWSRVDFVYTYNYKDEYR